MTPAQGEIWWLEAPDMPSRPSLVLTRPAALPVLNSVLVAPITRTIRGVPTEVALGHDDGLSVDCAASFDNIRTVPKSLLTRRVGVLARGRWHEICTAMNRAIGC